MTNTKKIPPRQSCFTNICLLYVAVLGVVLALFAGMEDYVRNKEWRTHCSNLQLGEEYVPEGEALEIAEVVATLDPFMELRLNGTLDDPNPEGLAKRVMHPVAWQCLDGKFTVNTDINEHLRVGLFKEPGKMFPTTIRTSHVNFDADSDPKLSSIAVKVNADGLGPRIDISDYPRELQEMNVGDQDFIFISADYLTGNTASDVKKVLEFQMWGGLPGIMFFLLSRPTALYELLRILIRGQDITVPFLRKHNTVMPSRFGDKTGAKFILKPCKEEVMPSVPSGAKFFVKEMSNDYVLKNGVCMDMFVQVQVDSCKNPIESVNAVWDEKIAPLEKIAQLTVPKGTIGDDKCEFTTFNPWFGLEDHRPLGFMGRTRREVYKEGAVLRMKKSSSCPFFKGKMN